MNLVELKAKKVGELTKLAKGFRIEGASGMRKQELILPFFRPRQKRMA